PALFPQDRSDRGCSRVISAEIAEKILRVKRERPRRSIRRIIRMLERAQIVPRGTLHRSTVHRLLLAHRLSARPQRHGVTEPRSYYVDIGAAYIADSLKLICAELGIRLLHTQVQDCEAKGVIERWHRTWREEVGDELPADPLPLAELNAKHWAWLSAEYHARKHSTTDRVPREHWLAELSFLRLLPRQKNLSDVFLHRERRVVRKDGTVRFKGGYLEVRPELEGQEVELRFDPRDDTAHPCVVIQA